MVEHFIQSLHRIKRRYAGELNLSKIPFVSVIRKKIISMTRKKVVENVNGYTMHVDDIDTLALSWHHVFEPTTTDFFKKNILPGQTVIDLGANIRYFTLLFAGLVGPEGHVYAFEPEPENANLLRKNLKINSVNNVTVIEKAVGNEDSIRLLYRSKTNLGNHQIFDNGENRDTIEIYTTTLDAYFADANLKIDWIKMDIEGAEFQALQGMQKILHQNPHMVLVSEIFAPGLNAAGSSVEEYLSELKDKKFEFELIDENLKRIYPVSSEELIRRFTFNGSIYPNIICRHTNT
jgi:FkbM family methyltransferase